MKNEKFNQLIELENLLKKDAKLNTKKYLASQLKVDIKTILNYLNDLRKLSQKVGDKEYEIELVKAELGKKNSFIIRIRIYLLKRLLS